MDCVSSNILVTPAKHSLFPRTPSHNFGLADDDQFDVSSSSLPTVTNVNISLPPFWECDAELWFKATENLFMLKNVTNNHDKYLLTFSALNINQLRKVQHRLPELEINYAYDELKQTLLDIFTKSCDERLDDLFFHTELGDSMPTELLNKMRQLLGS